MTEKDSLYKHEDVEALADTLEKKGIPFDRIPHVFHPGSRYTTPRALVESRATGYGQNRILEFVRAGVIEAHYLAGRVVFCAIEVQQLFDIEQESLKTASGSRRPGYRKKTKS
jgi:hypothetical protein